MHHLVEATSMPPRVGQLAALAREALAFHQSIPGYSPTPLHRLDTLAHSVGVGSLLLKDESHRFGLNAFKGLGASFAVHKWLASNPGSEMVTFVTATDGNHGRSVAWAARMAGQRAVVFIPAHAAPSRVAAIRAEGAEVRLVPDGYDAAVRQAGAAADREGWVLVQDFALDGYQEIPDWIMAGYWTHAHELEPLPHAEHQPDVDLVILHAGVGTWPAAMVAYYWHRYGERRPRIVVVEPSRAACVLAGIQAGGPVVIDSPERTVMAGLDCATASSTALDILSVGADAFITIDEAWALEAMQRLASPMGSDPVVIAGESGAASVAALLALSGEPSLAPVREHLGMGPDTRVLVWSTEGATDPVHWAKVVGRPVPA